MTEKYHMVYLLCSHIRFTNFRSYVSAYYIIHGPVIDILSPVIDSGGW